MPEPTLPAVLAARRERAAPARTVPGGPTPPPRRVLPALCLLLALAAAQARAVADAPGQVARVAAVEGRVWLNERDTREWTVAAPNLPLTSGDRVGTDADSRADLSMGATRLRLDQRSEVELTRVDDDRLVVRVLRGSLAVRLRTAAAASEFEGRMPEGVLRPQGRGHFRVDAGRAVNRVAAWSGTVRVEAAGAALRVAAGQQAEWRRDGGLRLRDLDAADDDRDPFTRWVTARDAERGVALRDDEAEPDAWLAGMTGHEDLDVAGRWDRHPEFGRVWTPTRAPDGWAPYRQGRWTWLAPWGWTWVDDAPWAFAPSHYGRWLWWGNRWVWSPGRPDGRPAWAPGVVGWVGGAPGHGSPLVGWVPLGPYDTYSPGWGYGPGYWVRVNRPHVPDLPAHPPQVPTGPIMYGGKGVPDGVRTVPADALVRPSRPLPRPPGGLTVTTVPGTAPPTLGMPPAAAVPPGAVPGHTVTTVQPRPPAPVRRDPVPAGRNDLRNRQNVQ